jgi:hypothetical protein
MKRFFFFLLTSLLVILIIATFLFFYILNNIDAYKILNKVTKELEKTYAIRLEFKEVAFDIRKGLKLKGVVLKDVSNKNEVLFKSEEVFLSYDLQFLLKEKTLKITSVGFLRGESGWNQINRIFKRFNLNQPKLEIVKTEVDQIYFDKMLFDYDGRKYNIMGNIAFPKNRPLFLDLNALYKDSELFYSGTLNKANVKIKNLNVEDFFGINFPVVVEKADFKVEGTDGKYKLSFQNFNGIFKGINFLASKPFFASYDARNNSIVVEKMTLSSVDSFLSVKSLLYSVKDNKLALDVEKSVIRLDNFLSNITGKIDGKFSLELSDKDVKLNADTVFKEVSYLYFKNLDGEIKIDNNELKLMGKGRVFESPMDFAVNSSDLFSQIYNLKVNLSELWITNLFKFNTSSSSGRDTFFKKIQYSFFVENVYYDKFKFKSFNVSGEVLPDKINISDASGEIFGGKFDLNGKMEDEILSLVFSYQKGRLIEFSKLFFTDDKKIYGNLYLDGNVSLKNFDLSTLEGLFKGKIEYGEFQNVLMLGKLREFLFDIPLDHIYFDRILFDISVKDSKVEVNKLSLDSKNILSEVDGNYNIKNNSLSFDIFLSFAKSYLNDLPNVANIFLQGKEKGDRIEFKLFMRGNVNKLEFGFIQ